MQSSHNVVLRPLIALQLVQTRPICFTALRIARSSRNFTYRAGSGGLMRLRSLVPSCFRQLISVRTTSIQYIADVLA